MGSWLYNTTHSNTMGNNWCIRTLCLHWLPIDCPQQIIFHHSSASFLSDRHLHAVCRSKSEDTHHLCRKYNNIMLSGSFILVFQKLPVETYIWILIPRIYVFGLRMHPNTCHCMAHSLHLVCLHQIQVFKHQKFYCFCFWMVNPYRRLCHLSVFEQSVE